MKNTVSELIVAIVSYVTEQSGYVTKTKLLKLLYLFDIEFYRAHGTTFTGFQWKYFHLGPWTGEFDPLLAELVTKGSLVERASERSEFDTKFLLPGERLDLRKPVDNYRDEAILKSILDIWGPSTTGEILDHVYFRTEPMEYGVRNEKLDFTRVLPEAPSKYKRSESSKTAKEIKALRKEFSQKNADRLSRPPFQFTPPRYDDEFLTAMEKLDTGNL
jgi:hypothetical protein